MANGTFRSSLTTVVLALSLFLIPKANWALASETTSPALAQISAARAALQRQPSSVKDLNSLAVGLTRRARETGDAAYYQEATKALEEAHRLDPGNRQTLRISAWVAMGRHEFARAYTLARRFRRTYPEDSWNLSVMGDALMELGRYAEAEKTLQKLVDLRPGPSAYSRVAYLRETRGDLDGATEMMQMALSATDPRESEDRAWLMVQIAHLQELSGNLAGSEASYRAALEAFSGYHYALAGLSELMLRMGHAEEAATLASRAIEAAPHAERYLALADALRASDREQEALEAEGTFEQLALKNVESPDNENHDLVLFYLQRRPDPGKALSIARLEASRRKDIHTLDRLALVLEATGEKRQAKHLIRQILKIGTRDPLIVSHAAAMGLTGPS
ncbi:MAG: tetratricopeptide repeat protein [Acidobacteria bacterium]|nr:tetratricopeptide repeat protein [Acidobacteriota bacterium]